MHRSSGIERQPAATPTALCIGGSGGSTFQTGRPVLELVDDGHCSRRPRYRAYLPPGMHLADAVELLTSMVSQYRPGMMVFEEVWHHWHGRVEPDVGGLTAAELDAILGGNVERITSIRVDRFLWRVVDLCDGMPVQVVAAGGDGGDGDGRSRASGIVKSSGSSGASSASSRASGASSRPSAASSRSNRATITVPRIQPCFQCATSETIVSLPPAKVALRQKCPK